MIKNACANVCCMLSVVCLSMELLFDGCEKRVRMRNRFLVVKMSIIFFFSLFIFVPNEAVEYD